VWGLSADIVEVLLTESYVCSGIKIIPFVICRKIASDFGLKPREVEIIALENEICPARYHRNIGTIGIEGQIKLLSSRVAVVGCGGLGGWIIEMLARAGIGEIVMLDNDVFDDTNLNRQLFSTEDNLGKPKALAAAERVAAVNSAVDPIAHIVFFDEKNGRELLEGSSVVIDALDNNSSRRNLFKVCSSLEVPLVHGAIGGMFGQIGVLYPGDRSLWENDDVPDKGIEVERGNPPFTPAFVASLEVSEAIKVLTSPEKCLRGELLWFDLTSLESQRIKISPLNNR
jgi:molybdopterin/thiamine biosynthesis adenylyltransferase